MSDEHRHEWKLSDEPYMVVDTDPEQHPYSCACGAFTHDPETGTPCRVCAPEDYERRIDEFSDAWIEVWCQGGEADDQRYFTLIEPPDEIQMLADPFHPGQWIRVVGPWDNTISYERVRAVEQLDNERIYYPAQRDEAHNHSGESPGAERSATGPRSASSTEQDAEP